MKISHYTRLAALCLSAGSLMFGVATTQAKEKERGEPRREPEFKKEGVKREDVRKEEVKVERVERPMRTEEVKVETRGEPKDPKVRIHARFDRLNEQITTTTVTEGIGVRRERLTRTRDYFINLVDLGIPEVQIDTWWDGIARNDFVVGMPEDLVTTYWGAPFATESVVVEGVPAKVVTYKVKDRTEKVTIIDKKVRTIVKS